MSEAIVINRSIKMPPEAYFPTTQTKTGIVLHYTAGPTIRSATEWWKQTTVAEGTAYLIDTNGDVYEVFPPECWAWHLGVGQGGLYDKPTIGIELVNPGPLRRDARGNGSNPKSLYTWYNASRGVAYCLDDEPNLCISTQEAWAHAGLVAGKMAYWRGESYHCTFPYLQVAAAAKLCRLLNAQFNIPLQTQRTVDGSTNFNLTNPSAAVLGISTHSNWLSSKTDLGPWFPWGTFENLLIG